MKILLVDDDAGLMQLLQLVFESRGFEATFAGNGTEALEILQTELPDLILLDLMMPGIDGVEVCKRIRADSRTADIPVIVLTAKVGEQPRQAALAAGATAYLVKPIRPSELMQEIRQVLARSEPATLSILT